ncbi:MAG: peptidoglycan-binding domain-containing protein [Spartobacteria bacterium]
MHRLLILLLVSVCLLPVRSPAEGFSFYTDPLAPRDEDGLLHQMPFLERTDFAPRHSFRAAYCFMSGAQLVRDPAYVGALQNNLRRLGYYCGPTDGVFSAEVGLAITRMQKNYSQRVTGTLTRGVRCALHLP